MQYYLSKSNLQIHYFYCFSLQEEEEARKADEIARAAALAELRRLEAEREEREKRRQESELQAIKDRNFKEKMQQISQTAHGQKVLKKLNEDVSIVKLTLLISLQIFSCYMC